MYSETKEIQEVGVVDEVLKQHRTEKKTQQQQQQQQQQQKQQKQQIFTGSLTCEIHPGILSAAQIGV